MLKKSNSFQLLGAHMSIAGGLHMALERGASIGCGAIQLFVKNNMQWFSPPLKKEEILRWNEHPAHQKIRRAFAHSGYLINLCASNPGFLQKSRRALKEELARAEAIGLPFLVLHPGSHMGAGVEAGLKLIIESLDKVLRQLPQAKVRVALETTAGQGSALGASFEELGAILSGVEQPERLAVCLDTAHVHAAGYDLSTEKSARAVLDEFDKVIGLNKLVAIHMNDSKTARGSRVDRHEHIGKGKIGIEAFRVIMRDNRLRHIPKVLETPKGKELKEDVENLARLRELER